MLTRGDAQLSGRLVAKLAEQCQLRVDLFKSRRNDFQQVFARFGGGDTAVVRASSLTPSRSSSWRMARLKAGCDMPSRAAARVKLRS